MEYRELGKTGERISCVGMGTWKLGYNPDAEIAALREGISLGINFIDTAKMYHSEGAVGMAIKGEDVFIATKVSPDHFAYDDVIKACNRSLKELGIKAIDLYQLHWPNPNIPIKETMRAMEHLAKLGKIRHIGVSNFSVEEMIEAQDALKSEEIVSNQVEYSPFVREIVDHLGDFCREEKITMIAYSPLGKGELSKLKQTRTFPVLYRIGVHHGKSPFQVAISWLISKEDVVPIPKAASIAHVRKNVQAVELKLSKTEIEEIDEAEDRSIRPIASRLTGFTRRTTSFWSSIMEKRERLRKHGV